MEYRTEDLCLTLSGQKILNDISLDFKTGQIHAVIGSNGAGKSSLMKVLSGHYPYQTGKLFKDNKHVKDFSHDIAYVAQEVDEVLFNDLTVYDNLIVHDLKSGFVYRRRRYDELKKWIEQWQLDLSLDQLVRSLTLSQKQIIVILRAILQNKKLIVLDEPTASLSQKEVSELFRELERLKEETAIIFISHHIHELLAVADEVIVLRNGEVYDRRPVDDWTEKTLAASITDQAALSKRLPVQKGEEILSIKGISEEMLTDISLDIYSGEVVGIAGLVGAGKSELADYLFRQTKGLAAYVPEERQKHGLVMDHSINDNVHFASAPFIYKNEKDVTHTLAEAVTLKFGRVTDTVQTLSGGNQQKVVLMRGLKKQAQLFICDEPMTGIDVGAKQDIFRNLEALKHEGKGVIYLSSDFRELLTIADRIYVMNKGRIVAERPSAEWTEQELLYIASGGQ
ncbi:sugar ABC transporter ATP-binding protein [Macrococcus brunensis]|uniref:Sugar ABC transporter ATP-binding protein n=1 Tax=Macrococcus brunensis TaxID=198483 RepID=A0A4R6BDS3_9STAP|nr:sugar ABC transporter ATP-binding protein [Macrococcus brunensis]TDL97940.1 sugar ABC transporter ATP-binding protein [Macrococcus brunensis]